MDTSHLLRHILYSPVNYVNVCCTAFLTLPNLTNCTLLAASRLIQCNRKRNCSSLDLLADNLSSSTDHLHHSRHKQWLFLESRTQRHSSVTLLQDICCGSQHTYAHAQQLLHALGAQPQGSRFRRLSLDMEAYAAEAQGHPIAWKMHQ